MPPKSKFFITISLFSLIAFFIIIVFAKSLLFGLTIPRDIPQKQTGYQIIDQPSPDPLITPAWQVEKPKILATDPIQGDSKAKLIIIEFGDFECPYCKEVYPVVKKILFDFRGQVKLVWKDFPIPIHLEARNAALAARCSQAQGKFWQYHDQLFENQENLSREFYTKIALDLNLDLKKFNPCLDTQEKIDLIGENMDEAQRLNIDGTPYFFVGTRRIDQVVSEEEFERVVREELLKVTGDN